MLSPGRAGGLPSLIKASIIDLKEALKRLKKDKTPTADVAALEAQIRAQEKLVHTLETQAGDIDAAVFDLKAVNPNVLANVDQRTPTQIIASVDEQGRVVAQALTLLSALLV